MQTKLRAIRVGTDTELDIGASRDGSLKVAQYLPPYAMLVATNNVWSCITTSAVANLIVRPSTTALGMLYNGESGGGKSYVILRAFAQQLVSDTIIEKFGIWLNVEDVGDVAPGVDIATLAYASHSGVANYGGNAQFATDETVAGPGWFPWGEDSEADVNGILGGAQLMVDVNGLIVLPPTSSVAIHVVGASVLKTAFCVGFTWAEVQLDLG